MNFISKHTFLHNTHKNKATNNTKHLPSVTANITPLFISTAAAVSAYSLKRLNNRMFTAWTGDEATNVTGRSSKKECKLASVSADPSKYNLNFMLLCSQDEASRPVCSGTQHVIPSLTSDSLKHKRANVPRPAVLASIECAGVVSCGWQQTEGHWWFLTDWLVLLGIFSLSPVDCFYPSASAYHTRQSHPPQLLHNHGYYWLFGRLRHHFSHQCLQRSGGSSVFDVS